MEISRVESSFYERNDAMHFAKEVVDESGDFLHLKRRFSYSGKLGKVRYGCVNEPERGKCRGVNEIVNGVN